MAFRPPSRSGRGAGRAARRLAPLALEAWRRWQSLPPEEKDRYRAMARRYADQGRGALDRARRRGGPGGGPSSRRR